MDDAIKSAVTAYGYAAWEEGFRSTPGSMGSSPEDDRLRIKKEEKKSELLAIIQALGKKARSGNSDAPGLCLDPGEFIPASELAAGSPLAAGQATAAQAAQAYSVPAVEREQERIAFKDAHRHLELYEVPDAWGRPMFKHSHVEASWLGWIARASHGQAPAPVLHLVHSAFAEIAMAFPKAFALHKVGIADTAVREALAAPATAQADSVLEDAALWHWLAEYLVGTRTDLDDEIVASETVNDLRKLVKAAIKQGATK